MHDISGHNAFHTHEREVTLLFADLRGFTELAASLEIDPLVCELLAHVMDCLTEAAAEHDGFIVDYYGDGLVAMWNAPADQAEHPELACSAALQMLEMLPAVAADWVDVTQSDLRLGIGLHTGTVQVGNAGSTRHRKYGPRGPNVHLASRVEAATKELRVPLLATQPTVRRLSDRFATHRICRARMPGMRQPTDLYAVCCSASNARLSAVWQIYDAALRHFEQGRFQDAADTLTNIDPMVTEVPSRFLVEQAEREQGRKLRRRSTDKPAAHPGGVIALSAK
jgi:adenylate cyclase